MDFVAKYFGILIAVFILEFLSYNFLFPNRFPKIPGDIDLQRPIALYVPFVSALIITVILTTFVFGFIR